MKTINLNQQAARNVAARLQRWRNVLPYVVLIERFTVVRLLLLGVVGVLALWAIISFLYVVPMPDETSVEGAGRVVATETIDELEVWMEERQTQREIPYLVGQRNYFKGPVQ